VRRGGGGKNATENLTKARNVKGIQPVPEISEKKKRGRRKRSGSPVMTNGNPSSPVDFYQEKGLLWDNKNPPHLGLKVSLEKERREGGKVDRVRVKNNTEIGGSSSVPRGYFLWGGGTEASQRAENLTILGRECEKKTKRHGPASSHGKPHPSQKD